MAQSFLIIDGYNLMHAAGMVRGRYGPGDLQRCRERLIRFLVDHLYNEQRQRTTVVFDAKDAPPGVPRFSRLERMAIQFAPSASDADTVIEEMILAHSAPRHILLVSSDHRLQRAARVRRAKFIDSEDFFDQLEQRGEVETVVDSQPDRIKESPKYSGEISQADAEQWMAEFGDLNLGERETEELTEELGGELDWWEKRINELDEDDP